MIEGEEECVLDKNDLDVDNKADEGGNGVDGKEQEEEAHNTAEELVPMDKRDADPLAAEEEVGVHHGHMIPFELASDD
jgi:hypothetical protein